MTRIALGVVVMVTCAAGVAANQNRTGAAERRVPVTVMLDAEATHGEPAVILRRASREARDGGRHDVVVLHPAADAVVLSDAVRLLLEIRSNFGDTATETRLLRVRPQGRRPSVNIAPLPWAQRVIDDLSAAPSRSVAGVGRGRAVDIFLPPRSKRTRS